MDLKKIGLNKEKSSEGTKRKRRLKFGIKTAVTFFQVKGKIIETGADGFFLKPFKLSDFTILFKYL